MCTRWFEMVEKRMSGGECEIPLLFFSFPLPSFPLFLPSIFLHFFLFYRWGRFFLLRIATNALSITFVEDIFFILRFVIHSLHSVFDKQNDLIKLVKHFQDICIFVCLFSKCFAPLLIKRMLSYIILRMLPGFLVYFSSLIYLGSIFASLRQGLISFFLSGYPFIVGSFIEKCIFFSLFCSASSVINQVSIYFLLCY